MLAEIKLRHKGGFAHPKEASQIFVVIYGERILPRPRQPTSNANSQPMAWAKLLVLIQYQ